MPSIVARPRARTTACLALVIVLLLAGSGPPSPQALAGADADRAAAVAPVDGIAPAGAALAAQRPALARVRFATQFASGGVPMYLAVDRGYFQQEGVDLEFVPFASNSEMVPAIATDQVEAGGLSLNAATLNALARGIRLKAVLDAGSLRPGHGFTALVIRKEVYDAGRGRSLADLAGLNLANTPPGKATTNYCAMAAALQRAGAPESDVSILPLPFPDMVTALANGAIDGALMGEPFLSRSLRQGTAVKVMSQDEMYPYFTVIFVAYSSGLYANRPAAKGFARAYIRAVRDYQAAISGASGSADRAQVDESIARYTRIDVATVREMAPVGFSPNGLLNQDSMLWCYQWLRDQGFVPDPVPEGTLAALWGTELVDEVLGEIGRLPEQ
jgi:NitT/TauT family transport system substrate-binding protein